MPPDTAAAAEPSVQFRQVTPEVVRVVAMAVGSVMVSVAILLLQPVASVAVTT